MRLNVQQTEFLYAYPWVNDLLWDANHIIGEAYRFTDWMDGVEWLGFKRASLSEVELDFNDWVTGKPKSIVDEHLWFATRWSRHKLESMSTAERRVWFQQNFHQQEPLQQRTIYRMNKLRVRVRHAQMRKFFQAIACKDPALPGFMPEVSACVRGYLKGDKAYSLARVVATLDRVSVRLCVARDESVVRLFGKWGAFFLSQVSYTDGEFDLHELFVDPEKCIDVFLDGLFTPQGTRGPYKSVQHNQWKRMADEEGLTNGQIAHRHFSQTGERITADAVRRALRRMADRSQPDNS